MKRRTLSGWMVGALVGLSLFLLGAVLLQQPYTYRGSVIDPALPAADFTLTDQNGQPFQLSSLRGKVVMLFFGYTACPDVCPVTLAQFKQVRADLGRQADEVVPVFVTVDPARDTPDVLSHYLDQFNIPVIGLTGSPEELQAVWKDYGVFVQAHDSGLVDHTARVYVIDRDGAVRLTQPFGSTAGDMSADLRHLLQEKSQ